MNVKQGDLAIVIGGEITPEMAGAIVEVLRIHCGEQVDGRPVETFGALSWVVRSKAAAGIAVRSYSGILRYASERVIEDRLLRPISGLPDDTTTDTEQPIKEAA